MPDPADHLIWHADNHSVFQDFRDDSMNWTFTWRKTVSPKEFYEVFLYHSLDARAIFSRVTHYKNRRYIQYRGDWHAFDQAIRNNPEAFCQIVLAEHLL